jgi:DNA (cytosine-5)-methyltransferase 1
VQNSPKAFDLFCGCGGMALGLKHAGIDVRWANDCWFAAVKTFQQSFPDAEVYENDVIELLKLAIDSDKTLPKRGDVDILVGGPPCQGFSGYNRHRSPDDPRNSMVDIFLNFVELWEPQIVLMENVPGMLSMEDGKIALLILDSLENLGYKAKLRILQAGNYGLPQNRWRVFILASIRGKVEFPKPTHLFQRTAIFGAKQFSECVIRPPNEPNLSGNLLPKITVKDAISDLPPIINGGGKEVQQYRNHANCDYQKKLRNGNSELFDHFCTNHGEIMMQRIRAVPKRPGAGWLDLPEHLKPKNLAKHGDKRYDNRFGRLHWEGTFNTILTRSYPYWGRVIHPEQDRVLSARECARAQSFPDTTRLTGKLTDKYKQIGNAVPPILAKVIGKEIVKAFKNTGN